MFICLVFSNQRQLVVSELYVENNFVVERKTGCHPTENLSPWPWCPKKKRSGLSVTFHEHSNWNWIRPTCVLKISCKNSACVTRFHPSSDVGDVGPRLTFAHIHGGCKQSKTVKKGTMLHHSTRITTVTATESFLVCLVCS